MTGTHQEAISTKKAEIDAMIRTSEDHCVAKRPIDFHLEADIARAEAELERMIATRPDRHEEVRLAA